jgi:hypothetical protein
VRHSDPVTAADVTAAVTLVLDAFRDVPDDGWDGPAASLAWTCWETVEHMADDLFAYAFQLGPADPPLDRYVPVVAEPRRAGGPANTMFAERGTGTADCSRCWRPAGRCSRRWWARPRPTGGPVRPRAPPGL